VILDSDNGDGALVALDTTQTLQTVSQVSSTQANGQPSVSVSANQSAIQQAVPVPVRLVPNIMTSSGDQLVSVITGTNTVSLIPKIINLYNNIPTPNSKS
jgi:hypothetical protein